MHPHRFAHPTRPRSLRIALVLTWLGTIGCGDAPPPLITTFFDVAEPMGPSLHRVTGDAEAASNRVTGLCAEARGREHIFAFTAPGDGIARFALAGDAPALYVRDRWGERSSERACNTDVELFTGTTDVFVDVRAGETFFVIADSLGNEGDGSYELDFELLPALGDLASFAGTYRSRGYGLVIEIDAREVHVFEASDLHCLPLLEGPFASLAAFVDRVAAGPSPGTIAIDVTGGVTQIVFDPIDVLPEVCRDGGTLTYLDPGYVKDQIAMFDIFVETFRAHYAFFALRGVDWEASVAAERAKLTSSATDPELFAALSALIAPLHDGHAAVHTFRHDFESKLQEVATVLYEEHAALGSSEDRDIYASEQLALAYAAADNAIVGPVGRYGRLLVYGRLEGNVGYVRIRHLVTFRAEQGLFLDALDTALASLADTDRLVLDLRLNGGGSDLAAIEVARRFALDTRVFATKRARDGASFTPERALVVTPAANVYQGDVIVLVSGSTASAAEILTLAMRDRPNVTIVGWHTSGEFSDVFERQLPSGWTFGLSNEVYRAMDGNVYEAVGIPPDRVLVGDAYPRTDRLDGVDRVLIQAIGSTE